MAYYFKVKKYSIIDIKTPTGIHISINDNDLQKTNIITDEQEELNSIMDKQKIPYPTKVKDLTDIEIVSLLRGAKLDFIGLKRKDIEDEARIRGIIG